MSRHKKSPPRKKTQPKPPLTQAFNAEELAKAANAIDPVTGKTPLLAALDKRVNAYEIGRLLDLGADPNGTDNKGRTPIDVAYKRGEYFTCDLLIEAGAKPPPYDGAPDGPLVYKPYNGTIYTNVRDEMARETPLTYFIKNYHSFEYIYPIIANGADVNLRNPMKETPLKVAVEKKWPYVAYQLVRHGAWIDPDKPDPNEVVDTATGATRLIAMIMEGEDAGAVRRVLDEGADVNKPDRTGLTPLALARALKWPYVEKMLLAAGANPDVKFPDPNQMVGDPGREATPMIVHAASYQACHPNYLQALIDANADVNAANAAGMTALYYSAVYDRLWQFDMLTKAGADPFKKSNDGAGPLHMAALNNHSRIAARILETAPLSEVNFGTTNDNQTPLYLACGKKGTEKLCNMLLDHGADPKIVTKSGYTVLHKAAHQGTPELAARLIDLGVDVNATTKENRDTALSEAVFSANPDMLRVLLEKGASIALADDSKYHHPLRMLSGGYVLENKGAMARVLLEHGADPNIRYTKELNQSENGSVIYQAISRHSHDVAEELLKAGADPHGTSYNGESAMHYCLHLRNEAGAKLLLDYGFDPLKVFDYTTQYSSGGDVRTFTSAYEEAQKLDKKFNHDREYGRTLDMIEERLAMGPSPKLLAAPKAAMKPKSQ